MDYEGTNVVAATNQVTVADIDPSRSGLELMVLIGARSELLLTNQVEPSPKRCILF